MVSTKSIEQVWELMKEIPDPEIPVISIVDLGIVREIKMDDNAIQVAITPTYSGCPAMKMIHDEIAASLQKNGFNDFTIKTVYSPAWTTDWINEGAKERLRKYGIAPPQLNISCPRCESKNIEKISQFGSTPCKALYRCLDCKEPFDYFKCH